MNKAIILGRLTRDPEIRYTPNGKAVTNFSLAVNEKYDDKEKVTYLEIVAWEALGKVCADHLRKGDKALVEGGIQVRTWEDQSGNKRKAWDIVARSVEFLSSKPKTGADPGDQKAEQEGFRRVDPDEIPF